MWEPAPPPAPLSEVAEISSLFWLCTQINKTCTARGTQIPPPGKGVQQVYALIRKEEKMEQHLQWGREGFLGRAWKKKKKKVNNQVCCEITTSWHICPDPAEHFANLSLGSKRDTANRENLQGGNQSPPRSTLGKIWKPRTARDHLHVLIHVQTPAFEALKAAQALFHLSQGKSVKESGQKNIN